MQYNRQLPLFMPRYCLLLPVILRRDVTEKKGPLFLGITMYVLLKAILKICPYHRIFIDNSFFERITPLLPSLLGSL